MNWLTIYFIILVIGAAQGLLLGLSLLFGKTANRTANRFLGALLLFFAYRLVAEALRLQGILSIESWTYHIFLEYNWIWGALLYLFVRSFFDPNFTFQRRNAWHFVPVVIEFIWSNFIKVQNFYWDGSRASLSWLGYHGYMLWEHTPFQLIVASGLILVYVQKSQSFLQTISLHQLRETESLQWIRQTLSAYTIFSILVITVALVDFLFFDYAFNPFYIIPLYIGMSVISYWLGVQGYARRNANPFKKAALSERENPAALKAIIAKLEVRMRDEKWFLDAELSLTGLAKKLDVKTYLLTQALNRILNQSFNDYINAWRVREAQKLLQSPKHQHLTLLAIAYEAGFNSKASFNRIFKKTTGVSPSQWRTEALRSGSDA